MRVGNDHVEMQTGGTFEVQKQKIGRQDVNENSNPYVRWGLQGQWRAGESERCTQALFEEDTRLLVTVEWREPRGVTKMSMRSLCLQLTRCWSSRDVGLLAHHCGRTEGRGMCRERSHGNLLLAGKKLWVKV